jgi:hypothetical protein
VSPECCAFDKLVYKSVDDGGSGVIDNVIDRQEAYLYDGQNVVLEFARDDAQTITAQDLAVRYLHGPAIDQVLAEERVQ